ncbi:MAG: hypothetical protein FJX65_18685 [Alphaproteobacteria bacterium]|nr:hypothetical protein [Alphaproteobacteria bacterium]
MQHRTYRGKVLYIGDTVGERGREWFTVSVLGDGARTMRAMCEIEDTNVLRDVTYTVDRAWRPLDAFVRLTVKDSFLGSGWFRFGEGLAECETYTVGAGRISQQITTQGWAPSFGAHPVACDIWHLPRFDHRAGPGLKVIPGVLMSSLLPNGASGPMLEYYPGGGLPIRFYGREHVTVPAGTFDTLHFAFERAGRPPQHCWCLADDYIIVKIYSELLKTTYQLVEFNDDRPS